MEPTSKYPSIAAIDAALDKANTAYQKPVDGIHLVDLSEEVKAQMGDASVIPIGGEKGQQLMKNSNEDYVMAWKTVGIEKYYSTVLNLTKDVSIEITIPTMKVGNNILTKVIANGKLDAVDGKGLTVSGNKVYYEPTFTGTNVEVIVLYGGSEFELPINYQYVEGKFIVDQSAVGQEIANLMSLSFGLGGTVQLELDGTTSDWGTHPSHTFTSAGTYPFKITDKHGVLRGCTFQNQSIKLSVELTRYEGTAFTGLGNMFKGHGLTVPITFANGFKFKTPNVTGINAAFTSSGVKNVPVDLLHDCTLINNVASMFDSSAIEHIPTGFFDGLDEIEQCGGFCKNTQSLISVGSGIFRNKKKLTKAGQVFNLSKSITTIGEGMFEGCENLEDANGQFNGCSALLDIPENTLWGCTKINTLLNWASSCTSLTTFHNWFKDITDVTTIDNMFKAVSGVKHIPGNILGGMTKITTAIYAFGTMSGVETFDAGFLNPLGASVEKISNICRSNAKMTGSINDIINVALPLCTDVSSAFSGCKLLTGSALTLIENFTAPPTVKTGAVTGCTGLSDYTDPALIASGYR